MPLQSEQGSPPQKKKKKINKNPNLLHGKGGRQGPEMGADSSPGQAAAHPLETLFANIADGGVPDLRSAREGTAAPLHFAVQPWLALQLSHRDSPLLFPCLAALSPRNYLVPSPFPQDTNAIPPPHLADINIFYHCLMSAHRTCMHES